LETKSQAGLALGPAVRSRRAEIRRAIAAGDVDVAELVAGDGDQAVETDALAMLVHQLVGAAQLGAMGTAHVLASLPRPLAERGRLADLTVQQRLALAAKIREESDR
jgi:hypothetical protein